MTPSQRPPSPPPDRIPGRGKRGPVVSEQALRPYLGTYLFVWMVGGPQFWVYVKSVDAARLYGYVWDRNRWHAAAIPLLYIDTFY